MSNSTAVIAMVGLVIASVWAWAWLGFGASARRMSVRLEIGGGSAAGEMSALVWPLMPFLSLLWFLTGDLMAREASGFATAGPCMLIALVGVAVRALCLGGLPAWAYPGWMARRYYASHPGARERELGARAVI